MSIALDYTRRVDPAALAAAGVTDVFRYLSWREWWDGQRHTYPNPKIIQAPEYEELLSHGLSVTLNWEYDGRDWATGRDGGREHAMEALRQARLLGYPKGCTIVGSCDMDPARSGWIGAARGYAEAFSGVLVSAGYRAGVYGPWDVLDWCRDEVPDISMYWQCMSTAYSSGRNRNQWPGVHVWQRGHLVVAGQDCDRSDIIRPEWGQRRGGDMQLSDLVHGTDSDTRNVEDCLSDGENLRNWWVTPLGEARSGAPLPGSPGALLAELLAAVDGDTLITALASKLPTALDIARALIAEMESRPAPAAG